MWFFVVILLILATPLLAQGSPQEKQVQFGFFIDTYYASSAWRLISRDRQFLTQAAREREFNINLAHLEANLSQERVRGRLAIQFGTSVNANYQNESTSERYSNQFSHRNLQEAYVGYQLLNQLWLDAGIFFGHIGIESWLSHNNGNYSRALMAENTPYYASGVRLNYLINPNFKIQLLLLNGWQVITSPNREKSLGSQIAWDITANWQLTHATFAGNVAPEASPPQYRYYSNFILQYQLPMWQFALSSDVGLQQINTHYYPWYTGALHGQYFFNTVWSFALRLEYFLDNHQVLITTNTKNGFQVISQTSTLNYQPQPYLLMRLEYRNFFSKDRIYHFSDSKRNQEHLVILAMSIKS